MGRKRIDISGKRYGRLLVLSYTKSVGKNTYYRCLCDCGSELEVQANHIKSGTVVSCGCYRACRTTTHGSSGSRLYSIWTNIKTRCYNPSHAQYSNYGGRGIALCDEWKKFENFQKWALNSGYKNSLEIDRADVNGNYCPDNCRWVDRFTQAYNKGVYESNTSGTTGVSWNKNSLRWQARIGFKGKRINLGFFEDRSDAEKARKDAELFYYGEYKHDKQSDSG